MNNDNYLSFGDGLLSSSRKVNKLSKNLFKLDYIINWQLLDKNNSMIDKTNVQIQVHNRLRFVFACIGCKLRRTGILLGIPAIYDANRSMKRQCSIKKIISTF